MKNKAKRIILAGALIAILGACGPSTYSDNYEYYKTNYSRIEMLNNPEHIQISSQIVDLNVENELITDASESLEINKDFNATVNYKYVFKATPTLQAGSEETLQLLYHQQFTPLYVDGINESEIYVDNKKVDIKPRHINDILNADDLTNSYSGNVNFSYDSVVYEYKISFPKGDYFGEFYYEYEQNENDTVEDQLLVLPGDVNSFYQHSIGHYIYLIDGTLGGLTFYTINHEFSVPDFSLKFVNNNEEQQVVQYELEKIRETELLVVINEHNIYKLDEVDNYNMVFAQLMRYRINHYTGNGFTVLKNTVTALYFIDLEFTPNSIKTLEIKSNIYPDTIYYGRNPNSFSYLIYFLYARVKTFFADDYIGQINITSNQYIENDFDNKKEIKTFQIDVDNTTNGTSIEITSDRESNPTFERFVRNVAIFLVVFVFIIPMTVITTIIVIKVSAKIRIKKALKNEDY